MSDREKQYPVLRDIGTHIGALAEHYPRSYLWFMAVVALLGYACLLLFPLLAFAGMAGMYRALVAAPDIVWPALLTWLLVTGISGLASYQLCRFRPRLPAGVELDRQQAPALFQLVEETAAHYAGPGMDRILITDRYQLEIVNSPVSALPVLPSRSLMVGLPLLQCLSVTRFKCALARILGQDSGRSNRLLNWLCTLRSTWSGYQETAFGSDPGSLVVRAVFSLYAPLYSVLGAAAARLDELQADSYAMELFSDEDVLDAITADTVYRLFLRESYWPAIRKLCSQDATVVSNAHARMAMVLKAGLHGDNVIGWIEQAMSAEQRWNDPWPVLARRLDNIGHARAGMSEDVTEPPAAACLAISSSKLDAALADLSAPKIPQPLSLQAGMKLQRRALSCRAQSLLRRLKSLLPSSGHASEVRQ